MTRIDPEIYQRVQRRVLYSKKEELKGKVSGNVKVTLLDPTDFYLKCDEEDFLNISIVDKQGARYYSVFWDTQSNLSGFYDASVEFYQNVIVDPTVQARNKAMNNRVLFTGEGDHDFISLDQYLNGDFNCDSDFEEGVLRLFTPHFDLGFEKLSIYEYTKISVVSHQDLSPHIAKLIQKTSRFGFQESELENLETSVTYLLHDKFLRGSDSKCK